ncbi:hypothetical protein BE11_15550 [Sorangium cellulosum]|nr:hypothetical protein BE11_15550 [Sorangium cellulosum]
MLGKGSLSLEELTKCIREAAEIETLGRRFHLAGGEAFMYMEDCLRLFETAREAGFLDITATTNAFWAKDLGRARVASQRLREAGLTSLEISWDFWHQPFISPAAVSNCLEACVESEIETNLRILTTKRHSIGEALAVLRQSAVESAHRITSGPVFPNGRAAVEMDRNEFFESRGGLDGACHGVLNLTVNSFGNVFPCCAGIDQTKHHVFGNIKQKSIVDIASDLNRSPVARTIVFGGIGALLKVVRDAGIDVGDGFTNICHMCWSIFSRKDCVEAIDAHFVRLNMEALQRALTLLEAQGTAPVQLE